MFLSWIIKYIYIKKKLTDTKLLNSSVKQIDLDALSYELQVKCVHSCKFLKTCLDILPVGSPSSVEEVTVDVISLMRKEGLRRHVYHPWSSISPNTHM